MFKRGEKRFSRIWRQAEDKARREDQTETEKDRRASAATGVLRNDVFNEAYACVRQELQDEWMHTEDPAKREALYAEAKAMKRVVGKLAEYAKWREIEQAKQQMRENYE